MLKILRYNKGNSLRSLEILLERRKFLQKSHTETVNKIIKDVKKKGDKAVLDYEKKFSKIKIRSNKVFFF